MDPTPTFTDLYIPIRDFGRLGYEGRADPEMTRADVVDQLVSDELENTTTVLLVNAAEGTCRDITEDLKSEVWHEYYTRGNFSFVPSFLDDDATRRAIEDLQREPTDYEMHNTLHRVGQGV